MKVILIFLLAFIVQSGNGFFVSGSPKGLTHRRPGVASTFRLIEQRGGGEGHRKGLSKTSQRNGNSALSATLISKQDVNSVLSAGCFFAIDIATRRLFRYLSISAFPPSLLACFVLFVAQIVVLPQNIIDFLQDGAQLFAKWLPVFFVPSLITLPLADTSQLEFVKVGIIVVVGFVASLLSTASAVGLVRRGSAPVTESPATTTTAAPAAVATTPFSSQMVTFLTVSTFLNAINTVINKRDQSTFLLLSTLTSFVWGSQLLRIKKIFHPLVTCTMLSWGAIQLLSTPFRSGLQLYQQSAGKLLLACLGPAVVSLACSMYTRRQLMRDNWRSILTAIGVSTTTGLLGTAMAVRWLKYSSAAVRLSLLSRNITSPLAMAIAGMFQADVSLAVSMVVVTGLLGANFGASLLSIVGIRDPVARGLSVGAAAHGLGTAAMVQEKEAFPFAGAAMALSGFAATIAVSIPPIRNLLMRIAMG